ncbi:hypothetical protein GCM10022377_19320 [Zhihengliuella alba]|uniref:Uncharacterized protein n=2 Tax=Zhihengliuella alba TaxID=547018 RepID=A0ABP7DHA8_9MICC
MSSRKIRVRLRRSAAEQVPVVVRRRFDVQEEVLGIVLELGAHWVLLASLRDAAYFDGFTLLRLEDIHRVKVDPTFLPALRGREAWPPSGPARPLDLDGPLGFLPGIAEQAPVLALHEEARRPDMLWIAAVSEVGQKSVLVRMIDPDCTWNDFFTKVKYRHLTRIDFGDDYSRAVLEVAGPASPL